MRKSRFTDEQVIGLIKQANMQVCATGTSSFYGHLQEQWMKVGAPILINGFPSDCASVNTRAYEDRLAVIDVRKNSCLAAAAKD